MDLDHSENALGNGFNLYENDYINHCLGRFEIKCEPHEMLELAGVDEVDGRSCVIWRCVGLQTILSQVLFAGLTRNLIKSGEMVFYFI